MTTQSDGGNASSLGHTIRWAAPYDLLVKALTFGQEKRIRESMLDRAGISLGDRVLDIGCGTGTLALAAKRRVGAGGTVHGVDAGAEMVERAAQKAAGSGIDVVFDVAPAQSLPFPDGAFDVTMCSLVMHHLPSTARAQAVAEMRRVLRPGGRMLVVDLARAHGVLTALNPISLLHGHRGMRTVEQTAALMKEAGFQDIVVGHIGLRVLGYVVGVADKHSP